MPSIPRASKPITSVDPPSIAKPQAPLHSPAHLTKRPKVFNLNLNLSLTHSRIRLIHAINHAIMTTSLPSTVPLLDAFTYRHRNQHSASHWWSSHALLRRRVTALSSLLHRRSVLLDPSRKLGSSSSYSKSKSKQLAVVERQIQNHARHVRDHVVPRAHLYVLLFFSLRSTWPVLTEHSIK